MEYTDKDVKTWKKYPKTGIYYVVIPGQTLWISSGQLTKKQAIEWALNIASGGFSEKLSIRELLKDFFLPKCEWRKAREGFGSRVTDKQYRDLRALLENYIFPAFGGYTPKAVEASAVAKWLMELKGARRGRDLSLVTKKRIRHVFITAFDWLVFLRRLQINQLRSLPEITGKYKKREGFTREEREEIFKNPVHVFGSAQWALYFLIADSTGLRPQEVSALHIEDYISREGAFLVHRAIDETGRLKGLKTDGKGVSRRVVLLPNEVREKVEEWILKAPRSGLLLSRPDGLPLRVDTAGKVFCKSLDEMGFNRHGRTLYSLRHSFNTRTRTALGDDTARVLMGHTSEAMTENYDSPEVQDLIDRAKGRLRLIR